jgi:hypothetical protein
VHTSCTLQVFIEAYPEARKQLDYKALNLKQFWPGALVRCDGGLHLVSDPLRRPQDIIKVLQSPVGVSLLYLLTDDFIL